MNYLENISKNELRGELLKRGMTLSSFARAKGFPVVSVLMAYARHCGNDSVPVGKKTRAIIRKLYEEITTPMIRSSASQDGEHGTEAN